MNAKELRSLCNEINKIPAVWSVRAEMLVRAIKDKDVFCEEAGYDDDWRCHVGVDDANEVATVRYNGGLKPSFTR